jgi:hypothetical protein
MFDAHSKALETPTCCPLYGTFFEDAARGFKHPDVATRLGGRACQELQVAGGEMTGGVCELSWVATEAKDGPVAEAGHFAQGLANVAALGDEPLLKDFASFIEEQRRYDPAIQNSTAIPLLPALS